MKELQIVNLFFDSINEKNILRVYPEIIFCDSFVNSECVGAFSDRIFTLMMTTYS